MTSSTFTGNHASGSGGGIFNYQDFAALIVTGSTFSGNSALVGGGLAQVNSGSSSLAVTNSTFSGNSASTDGGGLYVNGSYNLRNLTVSGNSAVGDGGGITSGSTTSPSTALVTNSTISNNSASRAGGITSFTLTLTNSIVAGNTATTSNPDVRGGFTSGGHNLIGNPTGSGFADGTNFDIVGHPALLGTLGNHGGLTQTIPLLPGSPALDAIPAANHCGTGDTTIDSDQRSITRPQPATGACDIGAFEAHFTLTLSGGGTQTAALGSAFVQPLTVTFGGLDAPSPPSGAPVTFTANAGGSGQSAILGTPNPATTNTSGAASVTATANSTAGSYTVTASTPGAASVTFNLTNAVPVLVVNSTADGAANGANCLAGNPNTCRLRDAIADATPGNNTITFSSAVFPANTPTTITLDQATGTLTLAADQTIDGTGHTIVIDGGCTVDGNSQCTSGGVRVFLVNSGIVVSLNTLTVQHGNATTGGGIRNDGTLTVTNSTLSDNNAGGFGGGIWNGGAATVTNSTLSGNSAANGGGITSVGTLTVTKTTLTGNTASNNGGGIGSSGTLTVTNSTLSGNSATSGGGILNNGTLTATNSTLSNNGATDGGGITILGGPVTVTNTIVAGNTATGSSPDINGVVTTTGNNLLSTISGTTGIMGGTNGDIVNPVPLLGTLGTYSGATQTIPLLPGSPAIDVGDDTTCQATGAGKVGNLDQRGISRTGFGAHCDIGAFESQGFTMSKQSGDSQSAAASASFANPLVASVTSGHSEPVAGGQVTFTIVPNAGAQATFGALAGCTLSNGNLKAVCAITSTTATSPTLTAGTTKGGFTVTAAATGASTQTFALTVADTAPVLTTSGGATAFTAGDNVTATPVTVDTGLTVSDTDDTTLASATASITGNFQSGQDVLAFTNTSATTFGNIAAAYNTGTGVLTLTSAGATATVTQWQAALRAVTYTNTAVTPNTANRTVSFVANDGTLSSTAATKTVSVIATDQTPIVTTSGGTTSYTTANAIVAVDPGVTVSDRDSSTLASGTVSITGNFQSAEDVLAFTNDGSTMGNVSASYNAGTGVLTLISSGATATLAQWQAALRAVTYTDTAATPNTATRTLSFTVSDGTKASTPGAMSIAFNLTNTPKLTRITPSSGNTAGGNRVTLTGVGFGTTANTQVLIDGVAIPVGSLASVTGTQIAYTAPAHVAGTVTITVKVNGVALAGTVSYQYGTVIPLPGQSPNGGSPGNPNPLPVNRPTGPSQPGPTNPLPGSRP